MDCRNYKVNEVLGNSMIFNIKWIQNIYNKDFQEKYIQYLHTHKKYSKQSIRQPSEGNHLKNVTKEMNSGV